MRDTFIKLKDGRTFCGPVWEWRPKEGWLSLVLPDDELPNPENRIYLADVESGYHKGLAQFHEDLWGPGQNVNVLERARKEGWVP